jgi:hypothetical protein
MNPNTSIQRINDMQTLELNLNNDPEDYPNIINNRSTTPVMYKAY